MDGSARLIRTRRVLWTALAAATGITIALTGCTSARDAQAGGGASAERVEGGTLSVAVALDALPSGVFGTLDRNFPWIDNVFEPLIRLGKDRTVKPVLATKVTVAPDGKSAVIDLREGVTFHNGTPFTADAVKYTFQKSADPASGSNLAFVAKQFTAVTADSPTKLTVTFAKRLGDAFFDYLNQTEVVDPGTYAGLKDGSKVVGTGPFSFGDWRPGAGYTLTKYEKYWDAKNVLLDKVDYVVTTDAAAEINALKSGRVQVAYGLTASNAAAFTGDSRYQRFDGAVSQFPLGLNIQNPPLDNQQVRQAIAYAIDTKRINQQVFSGHGILTNLPWAPGTGGVSKEQETHYSYDVATAKKLIAQAGAAGADVKITYNQSNPTVSAIYQIVANNLTAIGLRPSSDGRDQPTYQAMQANATIPQGFLNLNGQGNLSPVTLVQSLPYIRPRNPSHFANDEYAALTAALTGATTDTARAAALSKLSDYLNDQAFGVTLLQAPGTVMKTATVDGIQVSVRGMILFNSAYVTK